MIRDETINDYELTNPATRTMETVKTSTMTPTPIVTEWRLHLRLQWAAQVRLWYLNPSWKWKSTMWPLHVHIDCWPTQERIPSLISKWYLCHALLPICRTLQLRRAGIGPLPEHKCSHPPICLWQSCMLRSYIQTGWVFSTPSRNSPPLPSTRVILYAHSWNFIYSNVCPNTIALMLTGQRCIYIPSFQGTGWVERNGRHSRHERFHTIRNWI